MTGFLEEACISSPAEAEEEEDKHQKRKTVITIAPRLGLEFNKDTPSGRETDSWRRAQ